eukprot:Rmarinus@m.5193
MTSTEPQPREFKSVAGWSRAEVMNWAREFQEEKNLKENFEKIVKKHNITGEALLALDYGMLKETGMSTIGDLAVLWKAIQSLQADARGAPESALVASVLPAAPSSASGTSAPPPPPGPPPPGPKPQDPSQKPSTV